MVNNNKRGRVHELLSSYRLAGGYNRCHVEEAADELKSNQRLLTAVIYRRPLSSCSLTGGCSSRTCRGPWRAGTSTEFTSTDASAIKHFIQTKEINRNAVKVLLSFSRVRTWLSLDKERSTFIALLLSPWFKQWVLCMRVCFECRSLGLKLEINVCKKNFNV